MVLNVFIVTGVTYREYYGSFKNVRCMKWAGNNLIADCKKNPDIPVKSCNSAEEYSENYLKCSLYLKFKKR